jgi:apolipoprotein N-acyltransferase
MTKFFNFFKSIPNFFFLALLSGLLAGTSYIPFDGWALLFCYIPLWSAVTQMNRNFKPTDSLKKLYLKVFFAGWMTQFILTLIGFNWIFYVSSEFGHLHWSLAAGALLLFAVAMHLYIPLSMVLGVFAFRYFKINNVKAQFFILALILSLIERIWPSIFEWNLAYTLLWIQLPLFQWADLVGFWGLSTWLYLFQAGLGCAYIEYSNSKKAAALTGIAVLALVFILSATGSLRAKAWHGDQQIKIAIAQGNVGNSEKIQSEQGPQFHAYIRDIYSNLSAEHLAKNPADVIIWPETALPFALDDYYLNRPQQQQLLQTIQSWKVPVITGAYSVSRDKRDYLGYPLTRNAVFYLSPQMGFLAPPYYKTNLLAFGEYLPLGEQFPFLYTLLPFVGVYEKGSGPITASLKIKEQNIIFGPQICYDSLSPGFTRGLSRNGAQIIFNVTNDSWFGWWAEPFQHGLMTLGRAIEARRPLVRSTNTGISSAILADGTQLQNSPIDHSWAYTYDISYQQNPAQSFYTRIGYLDWILWLCILGLLILFYKKGDHVRS